MSEIKRGFWPRRHQPDDVRRAKRKRRLTLAVLPTMLTLGNGVCGLASIAVVTSISLHWTIQEQLFIGGLLIFGGMLFDALDGSAARMTGQSSEFGAQLDSLCDAITFGAAPAVIVWRFSELLPHRLSWAIGVIFALCVLIRLARFNVETDENDAHDKFDGLPSPAAAGTLASFAIAAPHLESLTHENYRPAVRSMAAGTLTACEYLVPALAVILAYFMVSRYQYPHVIQQWVSGRRSPNQIGKAIFVVAGIFLLHELALPLAFCIFAFQSPFAVWRKRIFGGAEENDQAPPASHSEAV